MSVYAVGQVLYMRMRVIDTKPPMERDPHRVIVTPVDRNGEPTHEPGPWYVVYADDLIPAQVIRDAVMGKKQ